jgi:DNA (cytosine-5)-methyltransferase 1
VILDLFAGPGGWSEGLRTLGAEDVGVELDTAACATRSAAGHRTICADVTILHPPSELVGLIASPPCTAFSTAGTKDGHGLLGELCEHATDGRWEAMRDEHPADVWLPLEVGRWWEAAWPEWVACEQVPACLPIWQAYAERFAELGYSAWAGVVNAADYGVPQIRKRAVLLASRTREPHPPVKSHGPGEERPWVTMAEALGWPRDALVGFARKDDRGDSPTGYRERDLRSADEPAFTVTEKVRSWKLDRRAAYVDGAPTIRLVDADTEPSPTVTGNAIGHGVWQWRRNDQTGPPENPEWPLERPATTIAGRLLVPDPGANANRFNDSTKSRNDGYRVTTEEAAILQGFPADYPWRAEWPALSAQLSFGFGPEYERMVRTTIARQIGNAVPPPLAAALLEQFV